MPPERRRLVIELASFLSVFVVVMLVGAWPSRGVRVGFSRALSATANLALSEVHFGAGVQLQLLPLPASTARQANDNVEADTAVVLRAPGQPGDRRFGMSLRRDAYLPLLIFVALILAAPLGARRKAACLTVGVPIVLCVAIGSVCILVTYLLSQSDGTSIPEWQGDLSSFLFERWLTPPGNRVIAPLLFSAVLGSLAHKWPVARTLPAGRRTPSSRANAPAS